MNQPPRRLRWFVLLPLTVVAGFFTFLVLVNDWFEGWTSIFQGRGGYDTGGVDVPLADIDATWAEVYRLAAPALVLLVLVALAGPARVRLGAAVTAAVLSVVTGMALAVGWFDVEDAIREYDEDARAIAAEAPDGYVQWSTTSLPRTFAAIALAILVVVNTIVLVGGVRREPERRAARSQLPRNDG